jgi:hypothetical protein
LPFQRADHHVAVEREAGAAEHTDFADIGIVADKGPDLFCEIVRHGSPLPELHFRARICQGRAKGAILGSIATMSENPMPTAAPVIILVEPQLGENIGMVARAMANFSLGELRLVNPRDGWPNEKARSAASNADHVIDAVVVFPDLASAVADLNFVLCHHRARA